MDPPSDRVLRVGLRYGEVPPDREARASHGRRDRQLAERRRKGTCRIRQVGDSKGDVIEQGLANLCHPTGIWIEDPASMKSVMYRLNSSGN